jgi:hypothetical protein
LTFNIVQKKGQTALSYFGIITFFQKKLYNKSYFEAGRSLRSRSLLSANEDFEGEPDAERALLDGFLLI